MGINALGFSSGIEVKVLNDRPGPQRIRAWKPNCGWSLCRLGMLMLGLRKVVINAISSFLFGSCLSSKKVQRNDTLDLQRTEIPQGISFRYFLAMAGDAAV